MNIVKATKATPIAPQSYPSVHQLPLRNKTYKTTGIDSVNFWQIVYKFTFNH